MTGCDGVSPVCHGGDLDAARAAFPQAIRPWLDLSTGINPAAYPLPMIPAAAWTHLPGSDDLAALERTASTAYGAVEGTHVVAAPGSQSLIQRVPWLVPPGRVAVLGPTYGEHAPAWAVAGHRVATVTTVEACHGADVVVITNPNNPNGRCIPNDQLAELASSIGQDGLLVLDEAFADADPAASHAGRLYGAGRVIVLRSFGKFFGLAGVRLGFALTGSGEIAARMRALLGAWPVSGAAITIGRAALSDVAWQNAMRRDLAAAASRLDGLLNGVGFRVVGGTSLFRFAASDYAERWYRSLGHRGILTRRFDDQPERLRIGLPGGEAQWLRLAAALDNCA